MSAGVLIYSCTYFREVIRIVFHYRSKTTDPVLDVDVDLTLQDHKTVNQQVSFFKSLCNVMYFNIIKNMEIEWSIILFPQIWAIQDNI